MIEAFQHVGIGVEDIERSYHFYRKVLGFSVKLNDHEEEMEEMIQITGSLCTMRVIMAMNLSGGAAVELVQHTSSEPRPMKRGSTWGDLGYLATGVRVNGLEEVVSSLKGKGVEFETDTLTFELPKGGTWSSAFIADPDGLLVELLETAELRVARSKPRIGGFSHVTIGVSDMERSIRFYGDILGFDVVMFDRQVPPDELAAVTGGKACRMVMLKRSRKSRSKLPLEGGMIQLVHTPGHQGKPLFAGRRWGDVGIMEFALDVDDVRGTYEEVVGAGAQPFCEPTRIDMGWGTVGTFAYVKDPDGSIVEMVEVERMGYLPPLVLSPILRSVLRLRRRL